MGGNIFKERNKIILKNVLKHFFCKKCVKDVLNKTPTHGNLKLKTHIKTHYTLAHTKVKQNLGKLSLHQHSSVLNFNRRS